jgi:hypothetical protein
MLRPMRQRAHLHDFRGGNGGRSGAEAMVDVDVRAMEGAAAHSSGGHGTIAALVRTRGRCQWDGGVQVVSASASCITQIRSEMLCPPSRLEWASAEVPY